MSDPAYLHGGPPDPFPPAARSDRTFRSGHIGHPYWRIAHNHPSPCFSSSDPPVVPGFSPNEYELEILLRHLYDEAVAGHLEFELKGLKLASTERFLAYAWPRIATLVAHLGEDVEDKVTEPISMKWDLIRLHHANYCKSLPDGGIVPPYSTTAEVERLLGRYESELFALIRRDDLVGPTLAPPQLCWSQATVVALFDALHTRRESSELAPRDPPPSDGLPR